MRFPIFPLSWWQIPERRQIQSISSISVAYLGLGFVSGLHQMGSAHSVFPLWTLGYYSGKHKPAYSSLLAQDQWYGHLLTQCVLGWAPPSQLCSTKAQNGWVRKQQCREAALSPPAAPLCPHSWLSWQGRHLQCLTLLQRSQIKCTATASSDVYISFKLG